jgi:hypothetical protein
MLLNTSIFDIHIQNNTTTWVLQHQRQPGNYQQQPLRPLDRPLRGPEREPPTQNPYTPKELLPASPSELSHPTSMDPHLKPKRVLEEQYMERRIERGILELVERLDLVSVEKRTMVGHLARSGIRSSVSRLLT